MSARALGVQAARASATLHLDADCRVPNVTELLNWTIGSLHSGFRVAYTDVGFYDLRPLLSVRARTTIHHTARFVKRHVLRLPTTRGSNYAIDRSLFLELHDAGKLSVDLQIGPAAKRAGARVTYSGRPGVTVLTSGRRLRGGWLKIMRHFSCRLRYNAKVISAAWRGVPSTDADGFDRESDRRALMSRGRK